MKAACLINSYNYRQFLAEAVSSALEQTRSFDQILVVDDGSTDGSVALVRETFGDTQRVRVIDKPHGGQLSCLNRGVAEVDADVVFFLDADDRFRPEYLQTAMEVYERHAEIDFISVGCCHFGAPDIDQPKRVPSRDLGITALAAVYGRKWIGAATSCLSMRQSLLRKILPCPLEEQLLTCADNALVYGASVMGARKYVLSEPLVDYRVHGQNYFAGRRFDNATKMKRSLVTNRLIAWYAHKAGYDLDRLPEVLHREFRSQPHPTAVEWLYYLQLASRAKLPWSLKIKQWCAMSHHYLARCLATDESTAWQSVPTDATFAASRAETSSMKSAKGVAA